MFSWIINGKTYEAGELIAYVENLEKENAELKEQRFSLRNEQNTFLTQNEQYGKDLINSNENLTKAKEIIKGLLSCCRNYPQENAGKIEQAEQFIREFE